jgi:dihydroorotate dehydrogenase (fumarate)
MIDLSVHYAGLKLKSPVIVSSSGLTYAVPRIEKIEKAGAGAVVLKSLFEEQINFEIGQMEQNSDYPEASDYLKAYSRDNSVSSYLDLIRKAKEAVSIPVIASVNCQTADEWLSFTTEMEAAGADAIELNIYYIANNRKKDPREYEQTYIRIVSEAAKRTTIPVIVKLGSHFSNLTWLVEQLRVAGAAAVVLFNRFYAPDIDVDTLEMVSSEVLSSPADIRDSLRWVGIISSEVNQIDVAASTGVHKGIDVVKQILAGAHAVQVCSVLYRNGIDYLSSMIGEMKKWMEKKQFRSIDEFRGMMSYGKLKDPAAYERAQFIKYFSKMH